MQHFTLSGALSELQMNFGHSGESDGVFTGFFGVTDL